MKRALMAFIVCLIVDLLCACGGGGGDAGTAPAGATGPTTTISGTAALGAPAAAQTIKIRDSHGRTKTTTTNGDGTFEIDAEGMSAPWLLRMADPAASGRYLYGYAQTTGVANIHSLSDVVIRTWFKLKGLDIDSNFDSYGSSNVVPVPTEGEIAAIKAVLKELITDILGAVASELASSPDAFDPMTSHFSADHTGFDKILDGIAVTMNGTALSIVITPFTPLDTAITANGGNPVVTIDMSKISFAPDSVAPVAPAVVNCYVTGPNHILVFWDASASTDVVGYNVYQGGARIASLTSTAYLVPGLLPDTPYTFSVRAFDAAGNVSSATNAVTVRTDPARTDTTPPDAPYLQATARSSNRIDLDFESYGAAGYVVYRDGVPIEKKFSGSYTDTPLSAGSTHTYTVRAFDGAMNFSGLSNAVSTTTFLGTSGALDSSFGAGGVVTATIANQTFAATSVALQQDGKVLVAGYTYVGGDIPAQGEEMVLLRYGTDGSVDPAFGFAGQAITSGSSGARAYALAVQSDGKIVVAGPVSNGAGSDFLVLRYNIDGSLDTTFGSAGMVTTLVSPYLSGAIGPVASDPYAVFVRSDGKIVVTGVVHQDYLMLYHGRSVVVRYNSDGNLDSGFGSGGIVVSSFGKESDSDSWWSDATEAAAVQADGKVLVAGGASGGGRFSGLIARYNEDGTLDATFGSGGVTNGTGAMIHSMALQPDGKIVVDEDNHLVRYNRDGTNDSGFAAQQEGPYARADSALVVQTDGKLLVTGAYTLPDYGGGFIICANQCPPDPADLVLQRYNSDGTPDITFGSAGTVITGFDGNIRYRAALQQDGRIILTGSGYHRSNLVLRYLP